MKTDVQYDAQDSDDDDDDVEYEMSSFGDVRSLLHGAHNDSTRMAAWDDLLSTVHKAHKKKPREVEEEWFPYVLSMLKTWPDELRICPRAWLNAAIRGDRVPVAMAFVRGVDSTRMRNDRFRLMCTREEFSWVRHLTFGGHLLRLVSVQALRDSEPLSGLTSLHINSAKLGLMKTHALMKSAFRPHLKSLRLVDDWLADKDVEALLKYNIMDHIETLDLSYNHLSFDSAIAFAKQEAPCLKRLYLNHTHMYSDSLEMLLDAPWIGQLEAFEMALFPYHYDRSLSRSEYTEMISDSALRQDLHLPLLESLFPGS